MKLPFVSRDRFEDLQRRYDALEARYHELRMAGAIAPSQRRATVTPPPPSPDALAAQRMHDAIIDQMADAITTEAGLPPEVARAEAQRLREAAGIGRGIPG